MVESGSFYERVDTMTLHILKARGLPRAFFVYMLKKSSIPNIINIFL